MFGVKHTAARFALLSLMSAGCADDVKEQAAPVEPTSRPAIAARRDNSGRVIVSASWKGATKVTHWLVEFGRDADHLYPVVIKKRPGPNEIRLFPKTGFETVMTVSGAGRVYAVQALSAEAMVLGMSQIVEPTR
jgi:hypothetical protein